MNSTSKSIVNLALATSLALVSVTGWSAEEAKATKKKSAKNAVASLHAGTSSSDMSMKPNAFRSPSLGQIDAGTGGLVGAPAASGSVDPVIQTGGGTGNVVATPEAEGSTAPVTQTGGGTGDVVATPEAEGSTAPGMQTGGGTGEVIIPPTPEGSAS